MSEKLPLGAPAAGFHVVLLALHVFSGTRQTAVVSGVLAAVWVAPAPVEAAALSRLCPPLLHHQTETQPCALSAGPLDRLLLGLLLDPHLENKQDKRWSLLILTALLILLFGWISWLGAAFYSCFVYFVFLTLSSDFFFLNFQHNIT